MHLLEVHRRRSPLVGGSDDATDGNPHDRIVVARDLGRSIDAVRVARELTVQLVTFASAPSTVTTRCSRSDVGCAAWRSPP